MSINNNILFFLLLELINSHIVIRFNRLMSIIKEQNYSLDLEYVNQRVDNPYKVTIKLGEPSQYIPCFLKTEKYSFSLTNYNCPQYQTIYKDISKDFIYITPSEYFEDDTITEYHFQDSFFLEETTNNLNFTEIKIKNYSLTVDNNMKGPQCFHIGSQVVLKKEEKGNSLIDVLFKKKYIKSNLYEYKIMNDDIMHLNIGLELNNEEKSKYKFLKPILIYESEYYNNQRWGLKFGDIYIKNYDIVYKGEINGELDINLGCFLGNSDFHEYFKTFLKDNNISIEPKICEQDYYVYFFSNNMEGLEKIKNFEISFYFKELNYNFSFNYQDLFLEKRNGYYFLIAFERVFRANWKIGFPFFKKYKFVFEHDSELMGFYCPGCSFKESNFNAKNILIIFGIIIGAIFILIIGIFIGKKIYESRKKRANELLDLYEYKENIEINKVSEKI